MATSYIQASRKRAITHRAPHVTFRALVQLALAAAVALSMAYVVLQYQRSMPRTSLAAASNTTFQISAARKPVTVGPVAIGMNTAVWDSHLQDAGIPAVLQEIGAQVVRFPGGSTSDVYHWQTNSITPGQSGWAEPQNTFPNWMTNIVQPSGAQAMVTVNYGTNESGTGGADPAEAAAWVNFANTQMHYGVKYWEIGNEVYGNGYYGSSWNWEKDLHSDKSPRAYAENLQAFSAAMKAVDPSIEIGASLVAPGILPDGRGPEKWDQTVLSQACSSIDFVSVHWYPQNPGGESDKGLLASPQQIPHMMSTLRSLLHRYCGARASSVQVMVTETNSVSFNPGKQTTSGVSALFLAQDYLGWLQAGAANVDWWDLHDGPNLNGNTSKTLLGTAPYGDFGLISTGGQGEPPPNQPFPGYSALKIITKDTVAGTEFAKVTSSKSTVRAYALRRPHTLVVVLVNTSKTHSARVILDTRSLPRLLRGKAIGYSALSLQSKTTTLRMSAGTRLEYGVPKYSLVSLRIQTT